MRDALEVCAESESEPLALELIALAGTSHTPDHKTNNNWLDRFTAAIHRRIDQRDLDIAHEARRLLLVAWPRLPESCRRLALSIEHADWSGVVDSSLHQNPSSADAVAVFIDALDSPALLGTAVDLLTSEDRRVADRAESIILRLASRALHTPASDLPKRIHDALSPGPEPTLHKLALVLASALDRQSSHERSGPALAALMLLDSAANDPDRAALEPIRAIFADDQHPAFTVVRRLLRRDESPATRRLAWRLLGDHPLAMAALERIARSGPSDQHNALLEHAHLMLNPRRAELTAHLATTSHASSTSTPRGPRRDGALPLSTDGLSVRARRGLPRMLASVHVHPETRNALHVQAMSDDDAHSRLAHARHTTGPELADFCFDPSPEIAHTATLRWSSLGVRTGREFCAPVQPRRAALARKLSRSTNPAVRRVVRAEPTGDAIDNRTAQGRAQLLADLSRDRAAFTERLRAATASGEAGDRIEAIRIARRLGLLGGWHDTLLGMIEEPLDTSPARVVATAAAAIGDMPRADADGLLDKALAHPDPRVRANAIESLERLMQRGDADPGVDSRLIEFKAGPEHRGRANAIRALARRGDTRATSLDETADDLEHMLTDGRPPHRLAGVWLSERLLCGRVERGASWQSLAHRIAKLARDEADAHIKARAVRCSRRLLAELSKPARAPVVTDPAMEHARARLTRYSNTHAQAHAGNNA